MALRSSRNRRSAPVRTAKLAVGYSRFSTLQQGSIPEQDTVNDELAYDEGAVIVARFKDEATSRSLDEREGLMDMFTYLEAHPEVGYIVTNELERLTAGSAQRADVTRLCKRHRITILEEEGPIDPHDEDAMIRADDRANGAKKEVRKVAKRTARALRAKVMNQSTVVMRPPYGVRSKPLMGPDGEPLPSGVSMLDARGKKLTSKQIEPHPDELPWLVQIFDWAADGVSLNEICRRLMNEGVPTKTGRTRWDSTTVRGILDNPFYKGEMTWGARRTIRDDKGRPVQEFRDADDPRIVTMPSPLGALIDPAVWQRVADLTEAKRGTRDRDRRTLDAQVLDHRVFCGRCGHKMYGRADAKRSGGFSWRYLCLSSYGSTSYAPVEGFAKPCTIGHSISLKDILGALAGQKGGYGGTVFTLTTVEGSLDNGLDDRRERLNADIKAAKKQYEKAQELVTLELMSIDELRGAKATRDSRIAAAEKALEALGEKAEIEEKPLTDDYRALLTDLAAGLADESTDVAVRQLLLGEVGLDRIYVDKPRLRLHFR